MRISRINIVNIIISMIVITNCTNNTANKEKLFVEMYKNCEMNTLIKMSFVGKLYEDDKNVNFSLEPTSNISVIFPAGYNIQLLSFDVEQSEWVAIKDTVQYFPVDGKYIIGKNDLAKEYKYHLIGVIPSLNQKTDLRIVLYGHTYENEVETDKCTGAYLDFEFIP